MKKRTKQYSNECITYWPIYTAGKLSIIMIGAMDFLLLFVTLITLFGASSQLTQIESLFCMILASFVSFLLLRGIVNRMFLQITVSKKGIEYCNEHTKEEQKILWDHVAFVQFCKDPWRGRMNLKVYMKNSDHAVDTKKDKANFIIPVFDVDEKKLQALIPQSIWTNDPRYDW